MSRNTEQASKVCLVALTILLSNAANALTPAEIFTRASPSIWGVTTYDKDGLKLSSGSAVVIAPETLITNCHVLRKAARIAISSDNISAGAVLDQWDTVRDVCQIKAKNLKAPAVKMGSSPQLLVGQPVFSIGNPLGLELSLGAGLISSLRKNEQSQLESIQTTAPISPGSSGGGLFDDQARLVGITTFQAKEGQNLNFAIPVEWINELPSRHAMARAKEASEKDAQANNKNAKTTTAPQKTWHYQLVDMRQGKRKEVIYAERYQGNGGIAEEAIVDDVTSPAMQWQDTSPIFRMRTAGGIEWVELSPKLFSNGIQNHSLRGVSLLGGHFNVDVRNLGTEEITIHGKKHTTVKAELRGMREYVPTFLWLYTFNIKAWYSKELSRVVKITYRSTPLDTSTTYDQYEISLMKPAQSGD